MEILVKQGLTLQQKIKAVEVLDLESGKFPIFPLFSSSFQIGSATEEYGSKLKLYSNFGTVWR